MQDPEHAARELGDELRDFRVRLARMHHDRQTGPRGQLQLRVKGEDLLGTRGVVVIEVESGLADGYDQVLLSDSLQFAQGVVAEELRLMRVDAGSRPQARLRASRGQIDRAPRVLDIAGDADHRVDACCGRPC